MLKRRKPGEDSAKSGTAQLLGASLLVHCSVLILETCAMFKDRWGVNRECKTTQPDFSRICYSRVCHYWGPNHHPGFVWQIRPDKLTIGHQSNKKYDLVQIGCKKQKRFAEKGFHFLRWCELWVLTCVRERSACLLQKGQGLWETGGRENIAALGNQISETFLLLTKLNGNVSNTKHPQWGFLIPCYLVLVYVHITKEHQRIILNEAMFSAHLSHPSFWAQLTSQHTRNRIVQGMRKNHRHCHCCWSNLYHAVAWKPQP